MYKLSSKYQNRAYDTGMLFLPGVVQTFVTHPFEHYTSAPSVTRKKYEDIKKTVFNIPSGIGKGKSGKLGVKFKKFEYPSEGYWRHFGTRLPKSMISSAALFGTYKLLNNLHHNAKNRTRNT